MTDKDAKFDQRQQQVGTQFNTAGDAYITITTDGGQVTLNRRQAELAYLDLLADEFCEWSDKYTSLAGVAVLEESPPAQRLPLSDRFLPAGIDRLVEQGQGPERRVERLPVDDLRQAVHDHQRLVLLGEPGSGKTTTLWRLAYDLAALARDDPDAPLPVLVPLGGYTGSETIQDYLRSHLQQEYGDLAPNLSTYLSSGRLYLLLDALNEMPQRSYRERVAEIQSLLDRFPDVPVVVTCRQRDYVETLKLEQLEIQPLDVDRQRAYLRRYLGDEKGDLLFWHMAGGQDIRALWEKVSASGGTWSLFWVRQIDAVPDELSRDAGWRAWRTSLYQGLPPLLVLGANPYMLFILVWLYSTRGGSLPQSRAQIFGAFVESLLAREEDRCAATPERWPGANLLRDRLTNLAFCMQEAGEHGTAVERGRALERLHFDGRDPQDLRSLAASATLLEVNGEQVRYVHQLMQEYFAALALRAKLDAGHSLVAYSRTRRTAAGVIDSLPTSINRLVWASPRLALSLVHPDWTEPTGWEETIILLAGTLDDMTPLVDKLIPVNPVLAARCIGESGGVRPSPDTLQAVQQRLIDLATDPTIPLKQRVAAGNALEHVGDPRIEVLDPLHIAWCPIPAGAFLMGNTKQTDEMAYDWESPQHRIELPAYRISRYPVTVAQYAHFVEAGGYSERYRHCWPEAGWLWREKNKISGPERNGGAFDLPNHPVVGVSWYEAMAYCAWLSEQVGYPVTLPTEAQWEKAARGTDGRRYAWGDEISPEHANYNETDLNETTTVGIFPKGMNPYGLVDLTGNVWEWTSSLYQDYPYDPSDGREDPDAGGSRTLRGGAWYDDAWSVRSADRGSGSPDNRDFDVGFRLQSPGS